MSRWRVGVDSGGTFTDVCLFDEQAGRIETWKVPSTPDDPSRGIALGVEEGMRRVAPEAGEHLAAPIVYFGHGTTVATNALIQHRGVRTGLVTTEGFRDLLEIGRQKRPDLYDLFVGKPAGFADLITFDMGGTSTDVALLQGGQARLASEATVHGYPLKAPMLDIHTVGAGGGSIAAIDSGGLLKVGPRSCGADPGPACYDRGNEEPAVTDANVVLQTLNPAHLLGGRMKIRQDRSLRAIGRLAERLGLGVPETAQGILSVVTANMARAIRVISVQRGHDPRDYTLMAFGGAGPLHAARLAK